jgi:hypothetical protein
MNLIPNEVLSRQWIADRLKNGKLQLLAEVYDVSQNADIELNLTREESENA